MARTQAADYGQRREAIVEAAAALYAQHGFLGASLADLAASCNTSKSLIYHYYSSKEEILFDVMSSHVEALNEIVDKVAKLDGAQRQLQALIHEFLHLYEGAADRQKVLLNELDQLPAERRAEIVARQRRLIEYVQGLLEALQPRFKGHPEFARPAAMLFFGMINWTHTWYRPGGKVSTDQVADMVLDMVLGGLPKLAARV
jgi:AcrR family transcriptional regulator